MTNFYIAFESVVFRIINKTPYVHGLDAHKAHAGFLAKQAFRVNTRYLFLLVSFLKRL